MFRSGNFQNLSLTCAFPRDPYTKMLLSQKIRKSSLPRTWKILLCCGCISASRAFSHLPVFHDCECLSHVTRVLWRGKRDRLSIQFISFFQGREFFKYNFQHVLFSVGSCLSWINQSDVHISIPVASFREAQAFAQPCWDLVLYAYLIFLEVWFSFCLIWTVWLWQTHPVQHEVGNGCYHSAKRQLTQQC